MNTRAIPFVNLHPDDADAVREAINRVLTRGWFVLGPEVEAFETEFAAAVGARFAVGVASGTDAISLLLHALHIGTGDEVIVPAMTAAYTALAVVSAGAVPVIVDVDPETLTIDPAACAAAITPRTRAIVPVHLYGQSAAMAPITALAERHGVAVIEDCCQAHGATCDGAPIGTLGAGAAFSFYPTKNLGAMGDGGAVITNDAALAARVRLLRNGGQTDRYHHVEAGVNSRLDELQAAILRARLPRLPALTARRRALAARYRAALSPSIATIRERDRGHVYHLFPIRTAARDALQRQLRESGIETLIHYPVALPDQVAFARFRPAPAPVARQAGGELLSLPLHPRLSDADLDRVAAAVNTLERGRVLA